MKGAVGMAAENAILKSQVSQLQKANEAARARKVRVWKLTKHTTSMSVEEIQAIATQAGVQAKNERESGRQADQV